MGEFTRRCRPLVQNLALQYIATDQNSTCQEPTFSVATLVDTSSTLIRI